MVHLYNQENNIKDTSRGNTYHNKRFKQEAEKRGLIIDYDQRIGWSITTLNDEAKQFIDENINKDVFTLTRVRHRVPQRPIDLDVNEIPGGDIGAAIGNYEDPEVEMPYEIPFDEEEKPKQSTRKYICPKCKTIIRATKDVNVVCGDCDEPFEKEVK